MTSKQKRSLARELYIAGRSIDEIAQTIGVTRRTVQNYKSQDKDWDRLRGEKMLGTSKGGETLYSNFLDSMYAFLAEIRNSDLKPDIKAERISQIGDAFAKMTRVAKLEDPEIFKRGIIRQTLKIIILNAKTSLSAECFRSLIELIEEIDEELADVSL